MLGKTSVGEKLSNWFDLLPRPQLNLQLRKYANGIFLYVKRLGHVLCDSKEMGGGTKGVSLLSFFINNQFDLGYTRRHDFNLLFY